MNILSFLNLTDRSGKLSLTNISLIVILVKIAMSPFDYAGAAILLPVLASYMHKRYEINKIDKESKNQSSTQLQELQEQMTTFKVAHEEANKVLAETKKLLSNSNLAAGFMPKR